MDVQIAIPREEIAAYCQRRRVRRLSLFGSALRDDYEPESDIDLLVEFEPGARISLLDMVEMELELAELLNHKVDLRTPEDLSRYFRDQVVEEATRLYERAR